jgi:serine/threonine-protein kinase SRPK3
MKSVAAFLSFSCVVEPDVPFREQIYVAIKMLMSTYTRGTEFCTPEIDIMVKTRTADPTHPSRRYIARVRGYFGHRGPNGVHDCIVFELLGQTIASARLQHDARRLPIPIVKQVSRQLLLGLEYLHTVCRVIHTGGL